MVAEKALKPYVRKWAFPACPLLAKQFGVLKVVLWWLADLTARLRSKTCGARFGVRR